MQLSSLVCFTGDEAERMSSERDGLVQDAESLRATVDEERLRLRKASRVLSSVGVLCRGNGRLESWCVDASSRRCRS